MTAGWRGRAALLLLSGAACAVQASTPVVVADLAEGPPSGVYRFPSSTPRTLAALLQPDESRPQVGVVGHLFLPGVGSARVPAVVMLHGSGGLHGAMLDFWPRHFNAQGIAALVVDSFGPRGVTKVSEDPARVPGAADVADAFAALRLLASHPRVDPQRIAVMGFSRGGIAAWRAAAERLAAANLPAGLRFAAHVPVYSGGCANSPWKVRPGLFTGSPMLWVHGDADDYAPIAPCQAYATRIAAAGTPSSFVVIPGARHKFDADDTRLRRLSAAPRTLPACPLEWDIDSLAPHDRRSGAALSPGGHRRLVEKVCRGQGASVQGDLVARAAAQRAIDDFFVRVLRP